MTKTSRGTRFAAGALAAIGVASGISVITPAAANADVYYGAIAVGSNGAWGRALDYGSRGAAERVALNYCNGNCKILASFVNGCGAVAKTRTSYWGNVGDTLGVAQNRALRNGGYIYTWACTSNHG
jgi:hypothetical protein